MATWDRLSVQPSSPYDCLPQPAPLRSRPSSQPRHHGLSRPRLPRDGFLDAPSRRAVPAGGGNRPSVRSCSRPGQTAQPSSNRIRQKAALAGAPVATWGWPGGLLSSPMTTGDHQSSTCGEGRRVSHPAARSICGAFFRWALFPFVGLRPSRLLSLTRPTWQGRPTGGPVYSEKVKTDAALSF